MSAKLILLASYPKSGNTWARVVLQSLMRGRDVALNQLSPDFYGYPRRILFDDMAPVNASDLTAEEIDALLPGVFRQLADQSCARRFIRASAAFQRMARGLSTRRRPAQRLRRSGERTFLLAALPLGTGS